MFQTREQMTDRVRQLEVIRKHRNYTDNERIELARLFICLKYIELCDLKNNAIDQGQVLSWDYDKKLLVLIQTILSHTRENWSLETDEQRKGSLNNLVRAVLLLRKKFTYLYNLDYIAQAENVAEINLWRNFCFLVQCQITARYYGDNQQIPISFDEVNNILRESFSLIDTLLNSEIKFGLKFQQIQDDLKPQDLMLTHQKYYEIENLRQQYRDLYVLPYLNAFVLHKRENFRIQKILQALNFSVELNVNNPIHQMALLRQLQIIGESITGKNLSKQTQRLASDVDWQLFVQVRNKLSHNEWDIYRNYLSTILTVPVLSGIQNDLDTLRNAILQLQIRYQNITKTIEGMMRHYSSDWYLRPQTRLTFKDFIRDIYSAKCINRVQLIELNKMLGSNIRDQDLPNKIRLFIPQVFDRNQPVYAATQYLLPKFDALRRVYRSEESYHRNLENPDRREQQRIEQRLSMHQINIRSFNRILNYSEETYKTDQRLQSSSFEPLNLIRLIKSEMDAIRETLFQLPGYDVLQSSFPENMTDITDLNVITRLFQEIRLKFSHIEELQQAISRIEHYFTLIHKPLRLRIEGLQFGVRRGEMSSINQSDVFQDINIWIEPIKRFGSKCYFYSTLFGNPEVVEACFLRMARIQKYIVLLTKSRLDLQGFLKNFEEFKALRNFIHHGSDLFETLNIEPREAMTRYAHLFLHSLSVHIDDIESYIVRHAQAPRPLLNALNLHTMRDERFRLNHSMELERPILRRAQSFEHLR